MKTTHTSRHLRRRLSITSLATTLAIVCHAQTTNTDARKDENDGAPVQLSAFVVSDSGDKGYFTKSTISGTRSSQRIMDIPQEIAIANHELIRDLGADGMLPAVQMVSGGISRRGYNVGDDLYIRGFRASNTLKDGFSFGSNAVGTLYDVDRVEVVKGPAALIFGQASFTGGIINYVSRKPTRTAQAELRGAIGNFGYRRGEGHVSGPLNSERTLRYRVDVGASDSDWGNQRFGFYKDRFIGTGAEYEINERTLLTMDASMSQVDYLYPQTLMDPLTRQVLAQSDDFTIEEDFSTYDTHQERVTATLTSRIGEKLDVRVFVGYNNYGNDWLRPFGLGFQADNATLNRIAENYDTSNHFINGQVDIVKEFQTGPLNHKFALGGEINDSIGNAVNDSFDLGPINVRNPQWGARPSTVPGSGSVGYISHTFGRNRSNGAYAQDQVTFFDGRVIAVAGVRHHSLLANSGDSGAAVTTTRKHVKTVKRLGALVHPVKGLSVYYNYAESFLFNGNGLDYLGRPFVPSVGKISEFGVKSELFNGALIASGSYFDIELTNVGVGFTQGPNDPRPGVFGIIQRGTEKNTGGFEVSLATNWASAAGELTVIATAYSGDMRNASGLKPVHAVNNTGSLFGAFRFGKSALSGFRLGGGVYSQGEKVGPNLLGSPTKFPGYTTSNAFVAYDTRRLGFQLNVDNLGDKRFIEGGESAIWIHLSRGRIFKFTVGYRF